MRRFCLPISGRSRLARCILKALHRKGDASLALRVVCSAREPLPDWKQEIEGAGPNELVAVDFSKPEQVQNAAHECIGVVLANDPMHLESMEAETSIVKAAKLANVANILKVSCPEGYLGSNANIEIGRQHAAVEAAIEKAGFEGSTMLVRPNWMMDSLLYGRLFDMICGRTLSVSVKHGRIAMVHPMDVAEAIVKLLSAVQNSEQSQGKNCVESFALTGPEALSYPEITTILSKGIGESVRYSFFPFWAVQPAMWIRGETPEAISTELTTARAIETGAQATVTPTLTELLDHKPRTLADFVQGHHDAWPRKAYE